MRREVRVFVEAAAESFSLGGPVYEFGSFQVAGQEHLSDLRSLFPHRAYTGCDMRSGPGVDRIEDISNLSLADECAKTILCLETLEHVFEVRRAIDEIIRVLAPGGMMLISVPFYFHIHAHPSDYWRITPHALSGLLSPLAARVVGYQGVATTPHTVYAIAAKAPLSADFALRARQFTRAFRQRLRGIEHSASRAARFTRMLRDTLLSKGERRRHREYYQCHFDTYFSSARSAGAREPQLAGALACGGLA